MKHITIYHYTEYLIFSDDTPDCLLEDLYVLNKEDIKDFKDYSYEDYSDTWVSEYDTDNGLLRMRISKVDAIEVDTKIYIPIRINNDI